MNSSCESMAFAAAGLPGVDAALFRPMVGQAFATAWDDHPPLPLVLERVSERETPFDPSGPKSVSLLFAGPRDRVLPQGTYRFTHEVLGALDLFVVPLGTGRDRRITYQAVFG